MATTEKVPATEQTAVAWYALPPDEVTSRIGVDPTRGLSGAEASSRLASLGPNRFAVAEVEPRWRAFVRQYRDPMQIVLLVAGIGSLYPLKELGTGLVLLFLTLFNAVLGLRQEGKAAEAVAALQKMMIVKARVRRDGELLQIPAEELVPGDVVSIEAGDVVPADGRLLSTATLEIAEAALTGESLPVSKGVDAVESPETPLGDRTDMVFMNTNVTRGAGSYVVTSTGMATEVGHISHMLQSADEAETPLTIQLKKLTSQILVIAGAAVAVSVILNLSRDESFDTVFTAAIAFAISAIPTGLPAVVTTILSYGTQQLAKANAIMKRLRSTETLGSTSAINSDKTGTLTLNQMTAVELTIPGRRYSISGGGYSTEGTIKHVFGQPEVPLDQFLLPMALCADAVVKDGDIIGDPTEGALVVLAEKGGIDVLETRQLYPRVAELPFDSAYKLMATFHRMHDEGGTEVVRALVKGAPDQLLARAASRPDPADLSLVPVDEEFKTRYMDENERLASQGLRVMATGRKDFDSNTFDASADLLAQLDGLTVLALAGIVDPPRPAAKTAIATAHGAGMQVRMITGDHAVTAAAIASELGIPGKAITGAEFKAMSDDELDAAIDGDRCDRARRARGQGAAGRVAEAKGPHRRDDRRRRERRACSEERRHRDRDGNHRHRGLEGGRDDDPHRRQLRDHRQGGRARPRPLRQPDEVHPLPDGRARRLHRHLPRSEHLQHRRRRPLRAAADAVRELHDAGAPGDRPRLRPPRGGPDESEAAAGGRADPAEAAADLGRRRGARPRRGDARRDRLGRRPLRLERGGAHDGSHDVRDQQRRLLPHHARRGALGVLARRARRPHVPDVHRRLHCRDRARHRVQPLSSGSSAPCT